MYKSQNGHTAVGGCVGQRSNDGVDCYFEEVALR